MLYTPCNAARNRGNILLRPRGGGGIFLFGRVLWGVTQAHPQGTWCNAIRRSQNMQRVSNSRDVSRQGVRSHLWPVYRQQVDGPPPRFVSPQGCVVLQAIAGSVLVHRNLAVVGFWVAAGQGCLQVIADCQQLPGRVSLLPPPATHSLGMRKYVWCT